MPKIDYHARQEARRERLEAAADRANAKAAAAYRRADMSEAATGIPFGQPVLVGHHSEKRHRRTIERADNAMRASIAESRKADHYASKAASVGLAGISSDDPDGIEKLTEKLAKLEKDQALMTAANKAARKQDKAALLALGFGEKHAEQVVTVPSWGGKFRAFEPYQLSNNSARIRDTAKRISQLTRDAQAETKIIETDHGFEIIENADANRVQVVFPGKPNEATRRVLKSNGFRWAPSEGAWQRMLNNAGRYAAQCVTRQIAALDA
jgi:hypothetical protein